MFSDTDSSAPCDFILFGTLGDLACRKLLPALLQLEHSGLLHTNTRIIGCGREEFTLVAYHQHIHSILKPTDENIWQRFCAKLTYCTLDIRDHAQYTRLQQLVNPNERITISYFAISSQLFTLACQGLKQIGLTDFPARVVLEKPIGHDRASSIEINNQVAQFFKEEQIYRIDHYLGKETILNLLALRFANSIFSSNWDHRVIERVEITVAEEIGVEGRWDYYDKSGHARDMLQNHLLQILSLIAMDPPLSLAADNIRHEKLKVLKALRPIHATNVHHYTLRAQYDNNVINGQKVPGYLEEKGANTESKTETFVAVKAFIDNWRWSGVPFYLLTGKKLAKKQSEVLIYFKPQPHNIFNNIQQQLSPNRLIIRLQPDEGIELRTMNKIPGLSAQMQLHETGLDLHFSESFKSHRIPDAYERLVLEVLLGNQYLFVSREEIEHAWQWIDGIKSAWETQNSPLYKYPSGTWGPEELNHLFSGHALLTEDRHAMA
ncbi:MAG: glucose-6-phosphate dehydrogenase [Legionella sp.]|nr:MAG: glucose-6-phosphate dehydrogenase [Legionella sp.]